MISKPFLFHSKINKMTYSLDLSQYRYILEYITKSLEHYNSKEYEDKDMKIKAIYSIGDHNKADIVLYEDNNEDKMFYKFYLNCFNCQIYLDNNNKLKCESYWHPGPHDYLKDKYKEVVFKNTNEVLKYFISKIKMDLPFTEDELILPLYIDHDKEKVRIFKLNSDNWESKDFKRENNRL